MLPTSQSSLAQRLLSTCEWDDSRGRETLGKVAGAPVSWPGMWECVAAHPNDCPGPRCSACSRVPTRGAETARSESADPSLFPKLPLWAGVLITAVDVMIVLIFFRSDSGRQGMLLFEIVIVALVLAVFISFMILLDMIKPVWRDVFHGLVPSKVS